MKSKFSGRVVLFVANFIFLSLIATHFISAQSAPEPRSITAQDFIAVLKKNPRLPILDVRNPDELKTGHLSGAMNVPLPQLKEKKDLQAALAPFEKGKDVYLVCRSGRRSMEAAKAFMAAGMANVIVVEGGMLQIAALGGPVVQPKEANAK